MTHTHVAISPAVRRAGNLELARLCLTEEFTKLSARRGYAREIADAVEDMDGFADEGLTWRLSQAAAAVNGTGEPDDNDDGADFATADNGAKLNKDEMSALDQALRQTELSKKSKEASS